VLKKSFNVVLLRLSISAVVGRTYPLTPMGIKRNPTTAFAFSKKCIGRVEQRQVESQSERNKGGKRGQKSPSVVERMGLGHFTDGWYGSSLDVDAHLGARAIRL
jgi:hypothetical protein